MKLTLNPFTTPSNVHNYYILYKKNNLIIAYIESKNEIIILIGIPGCGKTTYANNLIMDRPDKNYKILST